MSVCFFHQAGCLSTASFVLRRFPPKRPRLSAVQFLKSSLSFDQHRSEIMSLLFWLVKSLRISFWSLPIRPACFATDLPGSRTLLGAAIAVCPEAERHLRCCLCSAEPVTISGFFLDCKLRSKFFSSMPELGRALLEECLHAFLLVIGGEQGVKDPALEAHAFGKRALVGAID